MVIHVFVEIKILSTSLQFNRNLASSRIFLAKRPDPCARKVLAPWKLLSDECDFGSLQSAGYMYIKALCCCLVIDRVASLGEINRLGLLSACVKCKTVNKIYFKNNASFSLKGFGDHIEWKTYSEGLKEAQSR